MFIAVSGYKQELDAFIAVLKTVNATDIETTAVEDVAPWDKEKEDKKIIYHDLGEILGASTLASQEKEGKTNA